MNEGDYALGAIILVQLQFPPLPDREAAGRMQKAAAMLKNGASGREVLKRFLPEGELAKFNPYHLGPGPSGGQFTTAEADGASSGEARTHRESGSGTKFPPGAGPTTQPKDTKIPREIHRDDGSTVAITFNSRTSDGRNGDQLVTRKLSNTLVDILSDAKDIHSVNISATTNGHRKGDHVYGDAADVNIINGVHVDSSGHGLTYAKELESTAMRNPNVRYVEGPFGNFVRSDPESNFRPSTSIEGGQRHVHISVFPER